MIWENYSDRVVETPVAHSVILTRVSKTAIMAKVTAIHLTLHFKQRFSININRRRKGRCRSRA